MDKRIFDKLYREIEYLQGFLPTVWLYDESIGYVQLWQYNNTAWVDALGVNGDRRRDKFFDVSIAKKYAHYLFVSMLEGRSLSEVRW